MKKLILPSARWIWPGTLSFDLRNEYALFRKTVELERVPSEALALVTADQSYRLYVNGHYICRGPARGYQRSWPCDEIDLAPWLRVGRNVIAVRAHNPGFSTFQYIFEGWAGFLFMARWDGAEIVSNSSWKSRRQTGLVRDTVPSSLQLFCQEHVDARTETDDWMQPDFDDRGWTAPCASAAWNSPPWHDLESRGIPLLAETRTVAATVLGAAEGTNAAGVLDPALRNLVEPIRREDLWHTGAAGDPRRLHFQPAAADHYTSILLDFGHTVVGNLRLIVDGATGGEVVDAAFVETVDRREDGGTAPRLDQTQVSLGSRLVCRPGRTDHTFYHPYGFRYLMLRVRCAAVPLTIEPSLCQIGYPFKPEGRFQSADDELNRIWKTCVRTQQVCSLDAYVDTPWREQAQWWGDARVQAWNTFHLTDDSLLLRRGIRCIARQTTPDGLTYGHAPTVAHHCVLPDFTLIWIITLWDYYWQTGSLDVFHEHQDVLRRALDYFRRHTNEQTGLVVHDPRHWLFLDWAKIDKTGQPALLSLWLLLALDKMAELHRLAAQPVEAAALEAWATRLRADLLALKGDDGLLCDGFDAEGRALATASIHVQTLALATGLATDPARSLERSLLPFIREDVFPVARPSVYWLTYVFSVLDAHGHGEEVVRYVRKHWAQMADHGTTWSQFGRYGGEHSHSHAWSAHPLYHLMQIIGGVRQRTAAWREIEFRPLFWQNHAETTIPTPHGLVRSRWHKHAGAVHVELQLPAGITARVRLPGIACEVAGGNHHWIVSAEDDRLPFASTTD